MYTWQKDTVLAVFELKRERLGSEVSARMEFRHLQLCQSNDISIYLRYGIEIKLKLFVLKRDHSHPRIRIPLIMQSPAASQPHTFILYRSVNYN